MHPISNKYGTYFDLKKFGEDIKAKRTESGLTFQKAADLIGVCPTPLHKIETGQTNPTIESFAKIMRWLQTDADKYIKKTQKRKRKHATNIKHNINNNGRTT